MASGLSGSFLAQTQSCLTAVSPTLLVLLQSSFQQSIAPGVGGGASGAGEVLRDCPVAGQESGWGLMLLLLLLHGIGGGGCSRGGKGWFCFLQQSGRRSKLLLLGVPAAAAAALLSRLHQSAAQLPLLHTRCCTPRRKLGTRKSEENWLTSQLSVMSCDTLL